MIIKRKLYSRYDDTDRLKGMKDSDILAEKTRKTSVTGNLASAVSNGIGGAGIGAGAGAAAGAILGKGFKGKLRTGGKMAATGALIGAGVGLLKTSKKASQEASDNNFYNQRLKYAQRQARRREKKDWKVNMTQRDGYSY